MTNNKNQRITVPIFLAMLIYLNNQLKGTTIKSGSKNYNLLKNKLIKLLFLRLFKEFIQAHEAPIFGLATYNNNLYSSSY